MQQVFAENQHPNVLLIDDQTIVAEMVAHMLHEQNDIRFTHVADAESALDVALAVRPSVILVDLKMPMIDGFGVIRRFRADPDMGRVPMILLSAEDSPDLKVRGFADGANDYLVKWPDKLELVARVRYHSSAYFAHRQRDDAFLSLHKSRQDLLARTRELAESQAALHHAQKMEAIGKLTGGVAHDFNNVLQIISGNLQLMKMDTRGNDKVQRRIASAIEGVNRGAKLASHLLAFARRQPLQPVVIDAGALIRGMDELLRRSIGDMIVVETVVSADVWNTLADPNQLENVILNLAINARDAMDGDGKLTVSMANVTVDAHRAAEYPEMGQGEYVRIAVSDTGTGMTPEIMDRAFEPFFTTKPAGQGTGLGLSMAYGFVKQSGGHIDIRSAAGEGTTVNIYLPRARQAAVEMEGNLAVQPVFGGFETILVVEDEPDVRATTVELLSKLGYLTLQAQDAASALNIMESGIPIDLLFTDVMMPGPLRSADMARRAKALLPDIRVLFTSGYAEGGIVQGGQLDPGIRLLSKPYSGEDLARKVRHILKDRQPANVPDRPAAEAFLLQERRV